MSNKIPQGYDQLVQLAEDAADGAHTHGATIGLVHVNETTIRTALADLIGKPAGPGGVPPATPGLKELWNVAKANKSALTAALRSVNSNSRYLARMCIRSLAPVLGERWNSAWDSAGFTSGSLAVPTCPLTMLQQLRAYYGANPAKELANYQSLACTSAACEAAVQAISDAASLVRTKMPRSVPARTNGGFARTVSSDNRAFIIRVYRRSTCCCRYAPTVVWSRSGSIV